MGERILYINFYTVKKKRGGVHVEQHWGEKKGIK